MRALPLALLSAALALGPITARADDFCHTLGVVIAAAPGHFRVLWGEKGKAPPTYFVAKGLPGAVGPFPDTCIVMAPVPGDPAYRYSCNFPEVALSGVPADRRALDGLVARVAACLGRPAPAMIFEDGRLSPVRFEEAGAVIEVGMVYLPDGGRAYPILRVWQPATRP